MRIKLAIVKKASDDGKLYQVGEAASFCRRASRLADLVDEVYGVRSGVFVFSGVEENS